MKNAIESIHGIKDIKIFKSESFFLKNYFNGIKNLAKANIIITTLNQIPRLILELFLIIIFCFFIFYNFNDEIIDTNLLPSLGLFIAASFKLIPSLSRILNSLNGLKFNLPATLIVKRELGLNKILKLMKLIIMKFSFWKRYKGQDSALNIQIEDFVFEDIKLTIKNTLVGTEEESGSGKSTFIDLIIGLQDPCGEILIDGKKLISNKDNWLKKLDMFLKKFTLQMIH